MARPRAFNEQEVLKKALYCFWEKGYEGASLSDLEKATGVKRISLYNAFENKENLFESAQKLYAEQSEELMTQPLNKDGNLDELITFIRKLYSENRDDIPFFYGCMMVNTSLETQQISDKLCDHVKEYWNKLTNLYADFYKSAQKSGKIHDNIDTYAAAAFTLNTFWGAMIINRLYKDISASKPQLEMLITTIESWKT